MSTKAELSAWLRALPNTGGHIVYHLFALVPGVDPEEELAEVYVGVTSNLPARLRSHARKWWWAAVSLEHTELQQFPTRELAEAAERDMIRWYQPAMNRAGRLLVVSPA